MTYGDYLKDKNKCTKILLTLAIIMSGYFIVSILLKSFLLSILMLTIMMIPGFAVYSMFKEHYKKKKNLEASMVPNDDMPLHLIKRKKVRGHNRFGLELLMWPYTLFCLMLIVESTSNIKEQIIHVGVTIVILVIYNIVSKKLNKNHLFLFEGGLIMNHRITTYDNVKKYQSIKLRNEDCIFEIQMNDQYSSMILSKESVKEIEMSLKNYIA